MMTQGLFRNALLVAIVLAALVRVSAFVFSMYYPVSDGSGAPVSPLIVSSSNDFGFYRKSAGLYFDGHVVETLQTLLSYYQNPSITEAKLFKAAPPLFPTLIFVFDYGDGNTLPLTVFYLLLAILLCAAWLKWLQSNGVPGPWLIVFALVPNPIWYMLAISPDLLFAAIFLGFYRYYFRDNWSTSDLMLWPLLGVALLLTRPNAVSIVVFVFADAIRRRHQLSRAGLFALAGFALASLVMVVFYGPYFVAFANGSQKITYFGLTPGQYVSGIYDTLPGWLDRLLSVISLVVAKVLYVVGLRPSYGGTPIYLVMIRSAIGLVLLPGLVYLAAKGDWPHRLLVGVTLLPVLLGASQERYLLFLLPIIFLFGVRAYGAAWALLRERPAFRAVRGLAGNRDGRLVTARAPPEQGRRDRK